MESWTQTTWASWDSHWTTVHMALWTGVFMTQNDPIHALMCVHTLIGVGWKGGGKIIIHTVQFLYPLIVKIYFYYLFKVWSRFYLQCLRQLWPLLLQGPASYLQVEPGEASRGSCTRAATRQGWCCYGRVHGFVQWLLPREHEEETGLIKEEGAWRWNPDHRVTAGHAQHRWDESQCHERLIQFRWYRI